MGPAAPPASPTWTGAPCPIRHGPPRTMRPSSISPNPVRLLPSAPSIWTHFPNSRAIAASSSNSLAPSTHPRHGKGCHCLDTCSVLGRAGEEQLAGPGSCEVWGCQGEEPRLRGRHGKAVRECYPEPLLPTDPFCSLAGFLASEGPWREAGGAPNWDRCVLLATGKPLGPGEYKTLGAQHQLVQP